MASDPGHMQEVYLQNSAGACVHVVSYVLFMLCRSSRLISTFIFFSNRFTMFTSDVTSRVRSGLCVLFMCVSMHVCVGVFFVSVCLCVHVSTCILSDLQ